MQQQAEPEMHNSSDATLYDRYALFTESEKILMNMLLLFLGKTFAIAMYTRFLRRILWTHLLNPQSVSLFSSSFVL